MSSRQIQTKNNFAWKGVWKTRKSGIRKRNRNPDPDPEPEPEPEPESGIRNKWMIQVGKYDWHQYSSSLLCIPRKMDDDTRSPFKKRYEYKEHSSYHSFQLHWVWDDVLIIQNIFAFVCRSRQTTAELIEMWVRVKILVCYALNLRRLTTVFLALGWILSNQYLAWKTCFDFHHTTPPFQSMIKFYVLVGFQATAVAIATVTQSTSFWITSIISKSSQTLGNKTFRI